MHTGWPRDLAKYKTLATHVAVIADVEIDRASGRIAVPCGCAGGGAPD